MNHFKDGGSSTVSIIYDDSCNRSGTGIATNISGEMMSMEVMEKRPYKGVRQRRWGKWVSEIRVPGTRERLWLGSYRTAEAAAVAHDTALFCLHGCTRVEGLNFPMALPVGLSPGMSPKIIQKVASQAGIGIDAQLEKTQMVEVDQGVVEAHGDHDRHSQYGLVESVNGRSFWDGDQSDDLGCSAMNEAGGSQEEEGMSISVDDMEIYL